MRAIFLRLFLSFVGNTDGRICLEGLNQNKISEWIRSIEGINVNGNSPNRIKCPRMKSVVNTDISTILQMYSLAARFPTYEQV